jgi:hypothetical protein
MIMKETIFEYGVTGYELDRLAVEQTDPDVYERNVSETDRLYDMFLLFKLRGDENHANYLWDKKIKNSFIVKPVG